MKVCEIKVNYLYTSIENKPKSYREKSDNTDILTLLIYNTLNQVQHIQSIYSLL